MDPIKAFLHFYPKRLVLTDHTAFGKIQRNKLMQQNLRKQWVTSNIFYCKFDLIQEQKLGKWLSLNGSIWWYQQRKVYLQLFAHMLYLQALTDKE